MKIGTPRGTDGKGTFVDHLNGVCLDNQVLEWQA
jgi:hypothetical protein